jgi:glycosyltransferase involved in cell wall biosynthesis
VPEAELHVYYGFDMWWATPMYKGQEWFTKWRAEMERLLQQDGVHYFGGVGHIEMADAYARAGFYVYPTETRETAPINLMKSMANGCVPITSRHAMSAIPEFCGEFDLGPDPRPGGIIKADPDWLSDWSSSVVRAIKTSKEDMGGMRARMKAYARARFSWDRVADEWAEHFER